MSGWNLDEWRRWQKFTRTPSYMRLNGFRRSGARTMRWAPGRRVDLFLDVDLSALTFAAGLAFLDDLRGAL